MVSDRTSNQTYESVIKKTKSSINVPAWVRNFYVYSETAEKARELYPLVSGFTQLFKKKEYDLADYVLEYMALNKLSVPALVTLVRTTYPAREKLKEWCNAVLRVKNELDRREVDSEYYLNGLL